MAWWAQHEDAWIASRGDLRDPAEAMAAYVEWLEALPGKPVFVGFPASFDFMFVYWYMMRFVGRSPFSFAALDIKTMAMVMLKKDYRHCSKKDFPWQAGSILCRTHTSHWTTPLSKGRCSVICSRRAAVAVNGMSSHLPEVICFRVTRYCNARCGFCLAPPDGAHPDVSTLTSRIDWLLASGVRIFHFCGGEPTIHPALADLIEYVHRQGGKTRLTTNGILLPERVLAVLKLHRTSVKVSVHGDREYHDRMVGRVAFDQTSENLRRMVASRLDVSVQTTVVSGGEGVVTWMAAYCVKMGVRRLSILPFIPRGSGYGRRGEYELTDAERQSLRELVSRTRKAYSPRLEIRWLDFTVRPVPVMEADGRVLLEGATESLDRVSAEMPPALVS